MSFQKPKAPVYKEVRLARITYDPHGENGYTVSCSCAWKFWHAREKVREDAIDRHLGKRHRGRGIRL